VSSEKEPSRPRRILWAAGSIGIVAVLAVLLYVGLIQVGLVRNPLDPVVGGDVALARSGRPGLRVLFVGNSLTGANAMPELVHRLAAGDPGARPVFAVDYTAPGWTLERASEDDGLARLLREVRWNVVVLQEQSRLGAQPPKARRIDTDPFAGALAGEAGAAGARTVLFMTWGYEAGDRTYSRDDTFPAMQGRLARNYSALASELSTSIAPVGLAWSEALWRDPELRLWRRDGTHPSESGSYLSDVSSTPSSQGTSRRRAHLPEASPKLAFFKRWLVRSSGSTPRRPSLGPRASLIRSSGGRGVR
jgi:hypothetical protein